MVAADAADAAGLPNIQEASGLAAWQALLQSYTKQNEQKMPQRYHILSKDL